MKYRALGFLLGCALLPSAGKASSNDGPQPLIISHAGGYDEFGPENTLLAYRGSVEFGKADYVEVDVRLSKDNVPIAFHDETLDRTIT